MKASLYFLVLTVSLILSACSQDSQDLSPVSTQIEKNSVPVIVYPYEYLDSFPELKTKWEILSVKANTVQISFDNKGGNFDHFFCEVEYSNFIESNIPNNELIFIGKPTENTFNLQVLNSNTVTTIRVFGVSGYVPTGTFTTQFPYSTLQHFTVVPVMEWTANNDTISVVANSSITSSKQVFMKIISKEGNMLVFLGKPATQAFNIPKYGDIQIQELNLYSLNSFQASYDVR